MPPNDQSLYPAPSSDLIYQSEQAVAWLRWLRAKRGLSQRALSSLTDIAQSEIQRIERNQEGCRLSSFVRICSALGVPPGWVLDVMIQSNEGMFLHRILEDSGFLMLMETLQVPDKTGRDALAGQLAAAGMLAAVLLRVSTPLRRAASHAYPTDDWRARFMSFAERLESHAEAIDRAKIIRALREQPIAQLQRFGLLSRSSLEQKRDDLRLPKGERRGLSFGVGIRVLTFQDVEFLWGLAPGDEKKSLHNVSASVKSLSVKAQLPNLLERLRKATEEHGKKSELKKFLGVPLASVSRWLSGGREPGGETTLQLLRWVELQERQTK